MKESIPEGPLSHRAGSQAPLVVGRELVGAIGARHQTLLPLDLHALTCGETRETNTEDLMWFYCGGEAEFS